MSRRREGAATANTAGVLLDRAVALVLVVATFTAYRAIGGPTAAHQSNQPHFVLLADALLHGHLWVDPAKASRLGDITPFEGRFYVSFPPMPALMMMPFVARVGPGFNDALFTVVLGAINTALAFLLARRFNRPGLHGGIVDVPYWAAVSIALLLGFGTVHLSASLAGTVWFTAHIVSVFFMLLYLLECCGRCRPGVAGLALAAAFLARTPAIFAALFWLLLTLRQSRDFPWFAGQSARFALPLVLAVGLLLAQNQVRFHSATDFGYQSMRIAGPLKSDLQTYGQFSSHFLDRNLKALLVTAPIVRWSAVQDWVHASGGLLGVPHALSLPPARSGRQFPIQFDPFGTGLWAVSPALLIALRIPSRREALLFGAAWLTVLVVAVPDLLYYNTGWVQYGYRFSLDFMPLLLIPVALGLRRPLPTLLRTTWTVLLIVSIASNLAGTRWFLHLPPY